MPSAGQIRAGRAFVELGVNDKTAAALNKASRRLKAFGAGVRATGVAMMGVGTAALAPLLGATKIFADMGSQIFDASQRTGVAVEALSALSYAAGQAGSDLETLEGGLKKMQRAVVEAAAGSKTAREALAKLRLTAADLSGLAPEKQFEVLAKRISALKDPAERSAIAMELFGKSGTQLLPMMAELDELIAKQRQLGIVMSAEDAAAADKFGDSLANLFAQLKFITFQTGAAIAKALQPFAEKAEAALKKVIDWTKANQGLVVSIASVAAATTVAGAALITVGAVITGAGLALGVVAAALGAVLSPIGLTTAAVIGLGAAFLTLTSAGRGVAAGWRDTFNTLRDDVLTAWGAIANALSGGDLVAASRVAMALVALEWTRGTNAIKETFADLAAYAQWGWGILRDSAAAAFLNVVASASGMADQIMNAGAEIWDWFKLGFQLIGDYAGWAAGSIWDQFKWVGDQVGAIFTAWGANLTTVGARFVDLLRIVAETDPVEKMRAALRLATMPDVATPKFTAAPGARALPGTRPIPESRDSESERTANLREAAKQMEEAVTRALLGGATRGSDDAAQKALDAAKAALDVALAEARNVKPIDFKSGQRNAADALEAAVTRFSSAGTFNPFGAGQLAGPMNQIAAATKESARSLKNLERKANGPGLVFK